MSTKGMRVIRIPFQADQAALSCYPDQVHFRIWTLRPNILLLLCNSCFSYPRRPSFLSVSISFPLYYFSPVCSRNISIVWNIMPDAKVPHSLFAKQCCGTSKLLNHIHTHANIFSGRPHLHGQSPSV